MNLDFDDNELDEFLKKRLGNFRKEPEPEHWKRFEQNFKPKHVSLKRFNNYRIALWSSVSIAASILIILLINPKIVTISTNSPQASSLENVKSRENEQSTYSVHEEQSHKKTEVPTVIRPSNPNPASVQSTPGNSVNPVQPTPVVPGQKPRDFDEYKFLAGLDAPELPVEISNKVQKTGKTPTTKQVDSKPDPVKHARAKYNPTNRLPMFSRKHSTRNLFSARRPSRNYMTSRHRHHVTSNPSAIARFLGKLDYKINVTPQYCGRTLNNKGGVATNDFDPQFYRAIEKGKITFAGGLEMGYPVNDYWSVYSGLKLSTYEREATNNLSHLNVSQGQIAIPTSAGEIAVHGLTTAQLNSQAFFESFLTLRKIEIPVIVRRQLNKSVYIDGGLKYSYIFSATTRTKLIGDNKPFTYDQISDIHDQNLSFVLGTGVTFITGSGLKFDAGPEICWNLSSLNPSGNLINKPLTLGLRTTISLERFQRN